MLFKGTREIFHDFTLSESPRASPCMLGRTENSWAIPATPSRHVKQAASGGYTVNCRAGVQANKLRNLGQVWFDGDFF